MLVARGSLVLILLCCSCFTVHASSWPYDKQHASYKGLETSTFAGERQSLGDDSFDYLLYTAFYPPSTCYTPLGCQYQNHAHPNFNQFTIHGLWPNRFDGTWPSLCTGEPLDLLALEPIMPQLKANWGNFWTGNDTDFWNHEWTKHGTCASPAVFPSEVAYFEAVLRRSARLPIWSFLSAAGIKASDSEMVTLSSVMAAIEAKTLTGSVHADCVEEKDRSYLNQVWICTEKNADMVFIQCPESMVNNTAFGCPSSFYIPEVPK